MLLIKIFATFWSRDVTDIWAEHILSSIFMKTFELIKYLCAKLF